MPRNKRSPAEPPALFDLEPEPPAQETPAPPIDTGPSASSPRDADRFAPEFVYDLTAPFIGYPGCGDDPSFWERHRTRITRERLLHHLENHKAQMATDYETMLYLSSASLAAPMTHDWAQVYFYLFPKCMGEQAKAIGNEVTELDPGQQEDLSRLRRWIYKQQLEHVKAKLRYGDQKELEAGGRQLEVKRPRMF